jgi:hypothetical protein
MANKYIKKFSPSLAIKATLKFHLTPVRMALINNMNHKCLRGCGGKEHFYTVGGNVN